MALELLLREAKGMSDASLMEVVRFMRFLKTNAIRKPTNDYASNGKQKLRHAGKYRGKGWMADDFNEPLTDFKEYM